MIKDITKRYLIRETEKKVVKPIIIDSKPKEKNELKKVKQQEKKTATVTNNMTENIKKDE